MNGSLFICVAFAYRIAFSFIVIVVILPLVVLLFLRPFTTIRFDPVVALDPVQDVSQFIGTSLIELQCRQGKRRMLFIGKHPPTLSLHCECLYVFVFSNIQQFYYYSGTFRTDRPFAWNPCLLYYPPYLGHTQLKWISLDRVGWGCFAKTCRANFQSN